MLEFREYWKKFCPNLTKHPARKMYDMYLETVKVSTDCKKKDNMATGMTATTICIDDVWNMKLPSNWYSLAPTPPQVCPEPCQKQPKGNNPMYVNNDKHIESSKINYLNDRASSIYFNKQYELPSKFGFQTSKMPTTTQALIDAFVTGKFKIKDVSKKDTEGFFYRPMENILFVDPAIVEDPVGLKTEIAALATVFQDTKDTIAIGTPAEGLAAVKALDAWTPVVSPLSA